MNTVIAIFREVTKTIMFTVLWVLPVYISRLAESWWFLLLFIASMMGTITLFNHYEDLALGESGIKKIMEDDTNEEA